MITTFKTIAEKGEGLFKDRGSKFLGFAIHVTNEEEVKIALDQLRKDYFDARHHCYAYVLGADKATYRANDDGEPNHSAGDPILGQIHSFELTDLLVVVIRYFGGTKLGVSGLINAYRTGAELAIKDAKLIQVTIKKEFELEYDYESTNEVMRLIDEFNIEVLEQRYEAGCWLKGKVRVDRVDVMMSKIKLFLDTGSKLSIKI